MGGIAVNSWPGPIVDRFWANVAKVGECWEWTGFRDHHGYGRFRVQPIRAGLAEKIDVKAHRAAYWLATGIWSPVVRHWCDNPPCVFHIIGGSQKDNIHDAMERGRFPPRPQRFSFEEKEGIRNLYRDGGISQQGIANQLGVSQTLICKIVKERSTSTQ
jgi:hypothetical protein